MGLAAGNQENIPRGQLKGLAGDRCQIIALGGDDDLTGAVPVGLVAVHVFVVPKTKGGTGLVLHRFQIVCHRADVNILALPNQVLVNHILAGGVGRLGNQILWHVSPPVGTFLRNAQILPWEKGR